MLALSTLLFAIDDTQVNEYTLSNGLQVITYEMNSAPVIYSQLTYNVGSKYEPYGQTGISHVVEHMMFKGTKRFDKGSIAELISVNGGVFNAFTSTDRTVYYELMPKNKIELAFDIESERMHKCIFDPEEFESEMSVIMEERKMRTENSAGGRRREEVNTLLYKSHPYRNPIVGWMEDLEQMTRDQAYTYYKKYYTPNNATLVLVGDFESASILETVKKYFNKVPRGPELPEINFPRVAQDGKKILEFSHPDILEEQVNLYFSAPTRFHEDGLALTMAGTILGGRSATSRLHKKLVRELKLCKSTGSGLSFRKDPATFNVSARLMPDKSMEEVEAILWQEIDSLANHPVLDYDLQKIKNRMIFDELTGDQKASSVGSKVATYENYTDWRVINEWSARVEAVSADDIMRVIKTYLKPESMVVVYSRPEESDSAATVAIKDETVDEYTPPEEAELGEIQIPVEETVKSGLLAKLFGKQDVREQYRPNLNDIIPPNPIGPRIDSLVLDNGVPVYFVEDHNFPTFYILGAINTGLLAETEDKPGLRQLTNAVRPRGTANRNYDEIIEEKSFTPYQLKVSQSWEWISLQGYSLMKDSDKMLSLLTEVLSAPSFPEDQIEEVRPRMITNAENVKKTETMKAFYGMFEQVFEGHHYSLPYAGDPEVIKNLKREDLVKFHDKYFSPENLKLVVVGDCDRQTLADKLNASVGSWVKPSQDTWESFEEMQAIEGRHFHIYGNPEYKQVRLDIAFNPVVGGIIRDNPDLEALRLLEYILCGSTLTSRMGVKLRDEQGLCYGINSELWVRDHGGYWKIKTDVDKDNLKRMLKGMLDEIKLVQEEGITEKELLEAKTRKIGLLPMYITTPDDIGVTVYNALRQRKPLDHFDNRKERILAVTAEDVQRVANKYLDTENYIIGVSGNISEDVLDEFK